MTPTQAHLSREIRKLIDTNSTRAVLSFEGGRWQPMAIFFGGPVSIAFSAEGDGMAFRIRYHAQAIFIDTTLTTFKADVEFVPEITNPTPAMPDEILREAGSHFKKALEILGVIQETTSAHWERLLANPVLDPANLDTEEAR
jgi:hypothetical protein